MFGKGEVKPVGPCWQAGLLSVALLFAGDARAAEERSFLIAGLDGKTFFRAEGSVNGPNGHDGLAVIDIADPARPRLAHVLGLDTSVYGPPTNLQITPDGRLGLVTSPVTMRQEGESWWAQGDDRLHVIDLAAEPPALIETIRVGRQPRAWRSPRPAMSRSWPTARAAACRSWRSRAEACASWPR